MRGRKQTPLAPQKRQRRGRSHRRMGEKQNESEFAQIFDDTLRDIAITNNDIFSVKTEGGAKIILFDKLSEFITDSAKRNNFCKAIINKLVNFSFENIFHQKLLK